MSLRVLMFSKALVVGAYQRKLEELARLPDVELTAIVPPYWREGEHCVQLENRYTQGYNLAVEDMALNGNFHLHYYPSLPRYLDLIKPHLLHIDEEPYNFASLHALWLARRRSVKTVFFTWQNIYRQLPPPFGLLERYVLSRADAAIAGSAGAREVLLRKGFRRTIGVIPQFGVDPELYAPAGDRHPSDRFVIGYIGRLTESKGLRTLVDAAAGLAGEFELRFMGAGPFREGLEALVHERALAERTRFIPYTPSVEVPARLRELDVLVLPSLTTPTWKEQFGRVLVEAMACEVPVVGSDSGEIPHVIGDAGLIFPEGDGTALRQRLSSLMNDEQARLRLAKAGRARVLERFTQARVAASTYALYREVTV